MPESLPVDSSPSRFRPWQAFVLGLAIVTLVGATGVYAVTRSRVRALSENLFVVKSAAFFRIPAARINGMPISYAEYLKNAKTLREFYEKEGRGLVPVGDEEVANQVMSRLFIQRLVQQYAEEKGIEITEEDIALARENLIRPFGSIEAARKDLLDQYGWDLERYIDDIVRPLILEQKVQEAFAAGTDEAGRAYEAEEIRARHILFRVDDEKKKEEIRKKAGGVLKRIQKGEDFAALAKEFGEDGTKDLGGDLGWFGKGAMVPAFEEAVWALEPGAVGDQLVETQFGFHIVKVEEKRMRRNFVAFMNDKIDAAKIEMIIPVKNPFEKATPPGGTPAAAEETKTAE